MVNTMRKMSRSNVKIRDWMERNGFTSIQLFGQTRWTKDIRFGDVYFDGIALKNNRVVLFQNKTNCKPTKKEQEQWKYFSFINNCIACWFNVVDYEGVSAYIWECGNEV